MGGGGAQEHRKRSVDDDGVTVRIGGKEFGVFEAGTIVVNLMRPALSSRDRAVYRRSGLA